MINIFCRHPTDIPIQVHTTPVFNRIPIDPPPKLLMIKPIPIQLQPGLRVSSSSGEAKLATNCTLVAGNWQEIGLEHGPLPIRGISVAFLHRTSVICHRRDIKVGILQIIVLNNAGTVGVFIVVPHRDCVDIVRVIDVLLPRIGVVVLADF